LGLQRRSPVSARRLGVGGMAISRKRKGRTNISIISINRGNGRRKQPKVYVVRGYDIVGMFKPTNPKNLGAPLFGHNDTMHPPHPNHQQLDLGDV